MKFILHYQVFFSLALLRRPQYEALIFGHQKICIIFSLSNQYCGIAMNHDAVAVVHDYFLFVGCLSVQRTSSSSSWCHNI